MLVVTFVQTLKWFFVHKQGKELMTSLFYMWAIAVLVTHIVWTSDHIHKDFAQNSDKKVAIFALIINRFSFLNIGYLQGASM